MFEIGWPIGLKWAQEAQELRGTIVGVVLAVVSMGVSGGLLYLAQREIALGTSYAVWTGIGAAGTAAFWHNIPFVVELIWDVWLSGVGVITHPQDPGPVSSLALDKPRRPHSITKADDGGRAALAKQWPIYGRWLQLR